MKRKLKLPRHQEAKRRDRNLERLLRRVENITPSKPPDTELRAIEGALDALRYVGASSIHRILEYIENRIVSGPVRDTCGYAVVPSGKISTGFTPRTEATILSPTKWDKQ